MSFFVATTIWDKTIPHHKKNVLHRAIQNSNNASITLFKRRGIQLQMQQQYVDCRKHFHFASFVVFFFLVFQLLSALGAFVLSHACCTHIQWRRVGGGGWAAGSAPFLQQRFFKEMLWNCERMNADVERPFPAANSLWGIYYSKIFWYPPWWLSFIAIPQLLLCIKII